MSRSLFFSPPFKEIVIVIMKQSSAIIWIWKAVSPCFHPKRSGHIVDWTTITVFLVRNGLRKNSRFLTSVLRGPLIFFRSASLQDLSFSDDGIILPAHLILYIYAWSNIDIYTYIARPFCVLRTGFHPHPLSLGLHDREQFHKIHHWGEQTADHKRPAPPLL